MFFTAERIESAAQTIWFICTPLGLTLAALILGVRLVVAKRYHNRMARATFLLILSFAVLVDRVVLRIDAGQIASAPDAVYAVFYTIASTYFLYALTRDWGIPFLFWLYRRMRGRKHEPIPESVRGVPDA